MATKIRSFQKKKISCLRDFVFTVDINDSEQQNEMSHRIPNAMLSFQHLYGELEVAVPLDQKCKAEIKAGRYKRRALPPKIEKWALVKFTEKEHYF